MRSTRTVSGAPPGSGASPAPALPLAAMRAPRERRSQSQAKSSPSWKATKRSSAKAGVLGGRGGKRQGGDEALREGVGVGWGWTRSRVGTWRSRGRAGVEGS
uniref:Uncharacterized protein n=1 Tax=Chelonoidis abingdonii TaxID=106734 RepID=A0A8C0GJM7_CHEAB